jgi:exopolyphosphatase/guanosine-5'-triphosphate,3'-diphosphate pyrophosphatase
VPRSTPNIAAALDLGSNSFHMIVARIEEGQLAVIDRLRDAIRLADGIDSDGNITPETMTAAVSCLERFGQRLADFPPGSVRAVGTNTLRNCGNSEEFLNKAEAALGHPIDIIAGVEEARLIYLGVSQSLAINDQNRLVMDIGGSSTELIIGHGYTPEYMESMEMGCVSVSRRFFPDGVVTPKRIDKARIFCLTELEPHISNFLGLGWQEAIGASGTIRSVQKVITAAGWSTGDITKDCLKEILDAFIDAGEIDLVKLDGLTDERRPVFIGGVIIMLATFEALGIKSMAVSDRALREGLLHDMLERFLDHDVRDQSIAHLAKRYHADKAQAERVKQTALALLPTVAQQWKLDIDEAENWLEWAAELHEIGLDIAHSRHHHHAAYIIEHSDLAGFSQQEQLLLATLVRSHRRKLPLKLYKELPKRISKPVKRLAAILRLAIILNRNRNDTALPPLKLDVNEKTLQLEFPPDWLAQHPLTLADLEAEAAYLNSAGFTLELS